MSEAIAGLSNNDRLLIERIDNNYVEWRQYFALYLECVGHTEKFNKFIKAKEEEFAREQSKGKNQD